MQKDCIKYLLLIYSQHSRCSGSYCVRWCTSVHSSPGRVWAPSLYSSHTDWDHRDGAGSAWQAVHSWLSADVATQEERQRACTVLVLVVLLVLCMRRYSVEYEVRIHYTPIVKKADLDSSDLESYPHKRTTQSLKSEPRINREIGYIPCKVHKCRNGQS